MADAPRTLVSDDVFRRLTDDILSGRFAPGEKLPTQRRLAADLGVNMASIREAVKRLEQLRLVEVRHGDAMRVADWRTAGGLDVLAHLLFRAGSLDRGTLTALMEARALMLSESARLAAERRSDDQAERLADAATRISTAPDRETAQALDWAFFATVVEAAGNLVLALVMNSIRHVYFERAELFARVVDDHEALAPLYGRAAQAIAGRDPSAAAAAVRELAGAQAERL
jgi:GntR family transcriptional regulator, transcriptional repressor for pyruvate dehydrogenase complex